jgi:hypothetical protein
VLGNDISNRTAPIICFDSSIFFFDEEKERGTITKFLDRFMRKEHREPNMAVINTINRIWYSYDLSIYVATNEDPIDILSDNLYSLDVCHTRIVFYPNIEYLRNQCQNQYQYFVSNDAELLSRISMKNAITLEELLKLIKIARG